MVDDIDNIDNSDIEVVNDIIDDVLEFDIHVTVSIHNDSCYARPFMTTLTTIDTRHREMRMSVYVCAIQSSAYFF